MSYLNDEKIMNAVENYVGIFYIFHKKNRVKTSLKRSKKCWKYQKLYKNFEKNSQKLLENTVKVVKMLSWNAIKNIVIFTNLQKKSVKLFEF